MPKLALDLVELALLVAKENIINDCKNIKLGHGTASYAIDKYGESYFDLVIANILAGIGRFKEFNNQTLRMRLI